MTQLSIVSVTKNSGFKLFYTFSSVAPLLEIFPDKLEWIIIDGCSEDKYSVHSLHFIAGLGLQNIKICIEPDSGIYNAMNKAMSLSGGSHVLFLNSGDTLVENSLRCFLGLPSDISSIYAYSYFLRRENSGIASKPFFFTKYVQALFSIIDINMPTSHNAMIYPTLLIKQIPFKENYSCGADFDQYIAAKSFGYKVTYRLSSCLSVIDANGYISTRRRISYKDYLMISKSFKNFFPTLYWRFRLFISRFI